jgi:hypothetical protein
MIQRTTTYKSRGSNIDANKGSKTTLEAFKKLQNTSKGRSAQDLMKEAKSVRKRVRSDIKSTSFKVSTKEVTNVKFKVTSSRPTSTVKGILTHEKLKTKTKTQEGNSESCKTSKFKPLERENEPEELDELHSDVEVNTERVRISVPVTGNQAYRLKNEVYSNIDGFSQSDIFERESHGYLGNSRKLLSRLKRNTADSDYGNLQSFYIYRG